MKSGLLCPVEDLDNVAAFYRDIPGLPFEFRAAHATAPSMP